ncbi:MAG: hypothetical protein V3T92_07260, partial [Anaerolineae bacterium]
LDDLQPVIELYHHTLRAGRLDNACDLLFARLVPNPLFFRFGVYLTIIELLSALFPDGQPFTEEGEAVLPRLKDEGDQAWTLTALGSSYGLSGQPRRAVPLFDMHNALWEKADHKENLPTGLGNLACMAQIPIGHLAAAEQNLRRSIELCRDINEEFSEAVSHAELGRLLTCCGDSKASDGELSIAQESFAEQAARQYAGLTWGYRALWALLRGETKAALEAAHKARELADVRAYERDIIRAEWLLGAAHRVLGNLPKAETHLTEALTLCRRINLVELEPEILLEMARLQWAQAQSNEVMSDESTRLQEKALELAREALAIADRCEYRLKQADIHNFLAQLALERGDREEAREHAEIARERAWCDGPPHCYKPALEEAERTLELCGGG